MSWQGPPGGDDGRVEALGELQLAVCNPLLGCKPPDPPIHLCNGSETGDEGAEVVQDALKLAPAVAMGGSHER